MTSIDTFLFFTLHINRTAQQQKTLPSYTLKQSVRIIPKSSPSVQNPQFPFVTSFIKSTPS